VPKISLQAYRTRIRKRREGELKPKKGKFKDTFSKGMKGQCSRSKQLSIPVQKKKVLLKLAEYMGI